MPADDLRAAAEALIDAVLAMDPYAVNAAAAQSKARVLAARLAAEPKAIPCYSARDGTLPVPCAAEQPSDEEVARVMLTAWCAQRQREGRTDDKHTIGERRRKFLCDVRAVRAAVDAARARAAEKGAADDAR